jgi:hypothetical protein
MEHRSVDELAAQRQLKKKRKEQDYLFERNEKEGNYKPKINK